MSILGHHLLLESVSRTFRRWTSGRCLGTSRTINIFDNFLKDVVSRCLLHTHTHTQKPLYLYLVSKSQYTQDYRLTFCFCLKYKRYTAGRNRHGRAYRRTQILVLRSIITHVCFLLINDAYCPLPGFKCGVPGSEEPLDITL